MKMNSKNVLIIGATTGIGKALCMEYVKKNCKVAITGRREHLLEKIKDVNPEQIYIYENDVTELQADELIKKVSEDMDGIDTIIVSAGMGEINLDLKKDYEIRTVQTNVLGFTDCIIAGYKYLDKRFKKANGVGRLAGISSIASFRGGDSGPSYYASKAYVSNYLEGLRKKAFLSNKNLCVTTIIPGFVDTALAKGVGGEGLFWVAPVGKAAKQIVSALDRQKDIVYITKRWRLIAWVLKIVPSFLYKRIPV